MFLVSVLSDLARRLVGHYKEPVRTLLGYTKTLLEFPKVWLLVAFYWIRPF